MYLIDGHNLIPKIPGLKLNMQDDEVRLIEMLQQYARISRKRIEVYFDGAPAEHAGKRKYGMITAHFILQGRTADDAIIQRIRKMGVKAKNVKVVSSDRRIEREVRSRHAEVISAEQFSRDMERQISEAPSGGKPEREKLSEQEIDTWLKIFQDKKT